MGLLSSLIPGLLLCFVLMSIMSLLMNIVNYFFVHKTIEMLSVKYLFWKIVRDQDTGKLRIQKSRFCYMADMKVVYRKGHGPSQDPQSSFKKDHFVAILSILISALILAAPFIFLLFKDGAAREIGETGIISVTLYTVLMIVVGFNNLRKGSGFEKIRVDAYNAVCSAEDIANVTVAPLEDYKDIKKTSFQERSYQIIRFIYGQCKDDPEIMNSVATWMEFSLPSSYSSVYDHLYHCLFAYYSTYKVDHEKAHKYYEIVKDLYDQNENSRGEISRAYYAFNIEHNVNSALEHMRISREKLDGEHCILKKVEKDNVMMLINRLQDMIG